MRLIVLSATLTFATLFMVAAVAQTRSRAAAPFVSSEVLAERSESNRADISLMTRRLDIVEADHATARERLARIETSLDIQGKMLWALITMAAGLVLDRVKSAISSTRKAREDS